MKQWISAMINRVLFWILSKKNRDQKRQEQTEGVLIVRFSHIGDFVVWLDVAKEFRRIYPEEKLTFLCYAYKNVKILAEKTGYFDEVIIVDTNGIERIKSLYQIGKKSYRIIINANPSRSILSDLYVLAPFAKVRIAQKADTTCISERMISKSDKNYDQIIYCDDIDTMELIRNGQFLSGLSKQNYQSTIPIIKRTKKWERKEENYFVICPGGETPLKYWEEEKYAEVINYIFTKDKKINCVVLGNQKEIGIAEKIKSRVIEKERIQIYSGKTDLLDYIEWIRNANYMIANDTSAVHIAAATDTQAYVIAVSWDRGRFHPYIDEKKDQTRKPPVSIHADVSCNGCIRKNRNLKRLPCLENGRVKCVSRIQSREIIEKIKWMYEGETNVSSIEKNSD